MLGRQAVAEPGDELPDRTSIGFDLLHRREVEVEVAHVAVRFHLVGLLPQYDLVDEAGGEQVGRWEPRDLRAGEAALESFKEAHEVPDGKDVGGHEDAKRIHIPDQGVHGVSNEFLTNRAQVLFETGPELDRPVVRGLLCRSRAHVYYNTRPLFPVQRLPLV